jgi:hypothetical protein
MSILKFAIIFLLLMLFAFSCVWMFRDSLSLLYWRAIYFDTPRAVGSGPRVIFRAAKPSNIGINLVGISEEEWKISHSWVPSTQLLTLSSKKTIITLGCWWDDSWAVTALPTDSNGKFINAINRTVGLSHAPLQNQIAYQAGTAVGQHVITPPKIGKRGDGYFLCLEVEGLDENSPIRDSGQSRKSHAPFGHGDSNTLESISVSTDGAAAQIGDLAVAIFSMDPFDNPNINIDLPEGWMSIGFNNVAVQNIGYRACFKVVSEPGRQSATCTWSDDSTFVAEATMVIFKVARPTDAITPPLGKRGS